VKKFEIFENCEKSEICAKFEIFEEKVWIFENCEKSEICEKFDFFEKSENFEKS
jgi:hypothetical protein